MRECPLAFVGGWEPLSFRRRAGYAWTDEARAYEEEFSDAALDRYLRMGATSIVLPFAKGFGLRATERELAQEKEIIGRVHARGLYAAVYVRVDALIPETVRAECPEVDEWLSRGMGGTTSVYHPQQSYRKRVCYSHPGAVAYLESVFRYAIETLGADQLHLDGYHVAVAPSETCRCARCLDAYRAWIRRRYPSPDRLEEIFGILDVNTVGMPEFPKDCIPPIINSPDIRAWYRFQWDRLSAFTRHIRWFVRNLNPNVAISINAFSNTYANAAILTSQSAETLLPWVDAAWSEDGFFLKFERNRPVSRISVFKTAREKRLPICCYHCASGESATEASVAFTIASNGGNPSCLGFTLRYLPHAFLGVHSKTRLTHWARDHWSLFQDAEPDAELAIIRHLPSMAWNGIHPWQAVAGLENLLVRMKVPWRVLNGIQTESLQSLRTVLLPDMECLSDEELGRLQDWVHAGGRLLFTDRTARYDEERRRRPRHPILDWSSRWRNLNDQIGPEHWLRWMYEDVQEWSFLESPQSPGAEIHPPLSSLGAGQLCWLREIRLQEPITPHFLSPKDLQVPREADAIENMINQLHGPFEVRLDAPSTFMLDTFCNPSTQQRAVSIVRTDDSDAVTDVTVQLRDPRPAKDIQCLSPDAIPPILTVEADRIRLDDLRRMALLVIKETT